MSPSLHSIYAYLWGSFFLFKVFLRSIWQRNNMQREIADQHAKSHNQNNTFDLMTYSMTAPTTNFQRIFCFQGMWQKNSPHLLEGPHLAMSKH